MKVKIKDLHPNPFRDIKNYPIDQEKVESLARSINQTGFWDNILARKSNGKVEIAYGHHRLVVLKRDCSPEFVVDIPVKDLDDATMIRIMANENDESWGLIPAIIHETVRVAYEYLSFSFDKKRKRYGKKSGLHREVFDGLSEPKAGEAKLSVIAWQVADWLGGNWTEDRVYHSLDRLGLIEKGDLDKESVESMPTEQAARDFTAAVKETKPSKETQKKVAKKIVKSRTKEHTEEGAITGKYRMETEMHEEEHGDEEKVQEAKRKLDEKARRQQFENYLTQVTDKAESLKRNLLVLMEYKEFLLSKHYQQSREGQNFVYAMVELFNSFGILMGTGKDVDLVESFKLLVESKKKDVKNER